MRGGFTSRAATSRAGVAALALAWLAAVLAGAVAPAAAAPVDRSLDPGLAAFLAAGGSLDDICGEGGHGHAAGEGYCDACLLLGPALLPAPACPAARVAGFAAAAAPGIAAAPVSSAWSEGAPRAPPLRA